MLLIGNIFIGILLIIIGIIYIFRLSTFSRRGIVTIGYKGTPLLSFVKDTNPALFYVFYTILTILCFVMIISGLLFLIGTFHIG